MNPDQGTELRSGRVINSSSETSSPADPDMAQANSNDSDTNDNSDISSQLSEIKESYERRINELHQEFSQLKDLIMAIVSKNNNESQPSSSKGPSKPTQQHGFDRHVLPQEATRVYINGRLSRVNTHVIGSSILTDGEATQHVQQRLLRVLSNISVVLISSIWYIVRKPKSRKP